MLTKPPIADEDVVGLRDAYAIDAAHLEFRRRRTRTGGV